MLAKQKVLQGNNGQYVTVHSDKKVPYSQIRRLIESVAQNGLKISPKKCQLFRKELQYMGNTIFIKDKRAHIKPLRSWLEAIQKLRPPMTVKGCRSVAGMVNFLSIFAYLREITETNI